MYVAAPRTFEKSVDDETEIMIKAKSGRRVVGHPTPPNGAFHA
jgi:hypothetical protein